MSTASIAQKIIGLGFLIRRHTRDYTRLQEGSLCPNFRVPYINIWASISFVSTWGIVAPTGRRSERNKHNIDINNAV